MQESQQSENAAARMRFGSTYSMKSAYIAGATLMQ